jgi:hypothetical protein
LWGKAVALLRYHLYHPIIGSGCFVARKEEQPAGFAMHLNRHLPALVAYVQHDLIDEGPENRCGLDSEIGRRVEGLLKPFNLSPKKLLKVAFRTKTAWGTE